VLTLILRHIEQVGAAATHAVQWRSSLATYAAQVFGDFPVADVDLALVLKVIEPLWSTKPETASRYAAG
jgi:hypothetical protein